MSYSKELLEYGQIVLSRRRQQASYLLEERKNELYSRFPRLKEIELELSTTGYHAIRTAISGKKGFCQLEKIKEKNLSLQQERRDILHSINLPDNYLTESFFCSICHDEGYKNGKRCKCYEKILKEES